MACNLRTARVFTSSKSAPACVALPSRSSRRSVRVEARARVVGMGVFGTKAGMMSFFTPEGLCMPATVLALEEGNIVTQVKTEATDGYDAVQVGYKVVAQRKVPKPELGHLKKGECPPMRHLREYRFKDADSKKAVESYKPGDKLDIASLVKAGDFVDVAGTSIGKGFQGTIKRYNMARGFMTHGSKSHREHGSIGQHTQPGRVFPSLKMAGHMGNERVTVKYLQVLKVDVEKGAIVLKGAVPGKSGGIVEVVPAKRIGKNWP